MNQHLNFVLSIVLIIICNGLSQISAIAPKGHPKVLKTKSVEKDLIRMLLNRYEQFGVIGRPVNDSKIKVDVRYGLQLFQILDLDENKQILRTNCWCMHKWTDSLLRWNESEYGNIKTVRIFPSQIWTPDIKLHNFADERLREHRDARVVVSSNGETLWLPQALFKSTCEVEITYFPFDTQICMLEFGSLTYDRTQMDILWWIPDSVPLVEMPYLDFSDYVPSNEWCTDGEKERDVHHINRTIQIRSVKKHRRRSQTVGNEVITREYPVLRYLVRLRRNPSFYVFMLVIPCVLLSSLTLVVFWLPPESPAKMMLGMNIFVAFFVLLLLLAESTPSAVKNFPLIGVFFCLNMIMITLSTFLATMVIHLYFRGDRKGAVPLFLRRIIIEGIGRLTLVRQRIPLSDMNLKRNVSTKCHKTTPISQIRSVKCKQDSQNTCQNRRNRCSRSGLFPPFEEFVGHPACEGQYMESVNGNWFGSTEFQAHQRYCRNSYSHMSRAPSKVSHEIPEMAQQNMNYDNGTKQYSFGMINYEAENLNSTSTLERDVKELKKYVKMVVNRQKETAHKSLIAMEWRTLAIVLDRLFFFIYVTTILIAVVVSVPHNTEPEIPTEFRDSEE
ncbi:Neuronal acetylcholine receptor subunit alpha-7 [Schistosoma japonicum]|uniref:Neuronal acetylcholine receptor subunit alpha-7 n=1 Tax=Schistosoma japonicum TaxID=6182 RepID=A0A4Z2D9W9_SCHJA|nr:Neuronal acetylcholine receptor subunit alpha-4 [Schistosoma japonicum]TNN13198.1 Neuronal acetylcholine receptor subunit alpha-7 [Schistosoma japonicum]